VSGRRDELLVGLLGAPLDGFVEERNRLAREARAAGDRETAAWLAALRRPAPHVWGLDQLARRDPHGVRTLTNLGRRLADAQARAVRGDREAGREMQELSREVQRAVDAAVRQGIEVLREAGHGTAGDAALAMTTTLRGVLAGEEADRVALEEGRLLAPVAPGFGFGLGATAEVAPAAAASRRAEQSTRREGAADRRVAEQRAAANAAAEAAEAADREVFRRRGEQRRADEAVAAARARLAEVQAELAAAEDEARAAADRVAEAVEQARAARREADRLQSALPPDTDLG